MASKNLGAVIQRAISDGAFRRQLQSDPAAALRGFNLTADEVAAIRSGDSSKLMSLGVDQRMSKAFAGPGLLGGAQRASISDLSAGGTASKIATDSTPSAREGIVGDPAATSRETLADPTTAGTRAIHDTEPTDLRGMVTTGDLSGTRAVNDSEPFAGNAVVNDNIAAANAGRGGSLAGDMSGGNVRAVHDVAPFGDGTIASQMADAGDASSIRAVNDVAPFDSGINAVASTEVIPTDELRAMEHNVDGDTGNALGNTGGDTGNEHSWG